MLAALGASGGPGCRNPPPVAASAGVARRKRSGSPSGSAPSIWKLQRPFCGQVTIGGRLLTGELFGVARFTTASTR